MCGFEATTPTGAAILATRLLILGLICGRQNEKTAYGVGRRKENKDVPNLLRVLSAKQLRIKDQVMMPFC